MGVQPNGPHSQLEAIPAQKQTYKPRKSIKPPHIKAAVIAKRMIGTSKLQISKDLGITENTVRSILSEGAIHENVQQVRSAFVLDGKLWKAADVLYDKLDKGSESAATTILRGFNVLQSNPKVEVNVLNVSAASYAQRMQAKAQEAIELKSGDNQADTTITSVSSESDK